VKRDVPAQLLVQDDENNGEYIATVPDALFHVMMNVRQKLIASGATTLEDSDLELALGIAFNVIY